MARENLYTWASLFPSALTLYLPVIVIYLPGERVLRECILVSSRTSKQLIKQNKPRERQCPSTMINKSTGAAAPDVFASRFEILWHDTATCQCAFYMLTVRTKEHRGLDLHIFHCLPDIYQLETLANLKKLYYEETQRAWIFFSAISRYHLLLLYTLNCQVTYLCEQNIWIKQLSTKKLQCCQRNNDFYFMFKEGFTDWIKLGKREALMVKRCSCLWGKNRYNYYGFGFRSCLLRGV